MTDDPFYCDDCDMELTHDDIETASNVPQIDPDTYELGTETRDVYKCAGCGTVIGIGSTR
jgi:hypothetical protein